MRTQIWWGQFILNLQVTCLVSEMGRTGVSWFDFLSGTLSHLSFPTQCLCWALIHCTRGSEDNLIPIFMVEIASWDLSCCAEYFPPVCLMLLIPVVSSRWEQLNLLWGWGKWIQVNCFNTPGDSARHYSPLFTCWVAFGSHWLPSCQFSVKKLILVYGRQDGSVSGERCLSPSLKTWVQSQEEPIPASCLLSSTQAQWRAPVPINQSINAKKDLVLF